MLIEIKNCYTDEVIFSHNCADNTIARAVTEAVKRGANLSRADLCGEILKKTPVSISNLKWDILITDEYMRVGCQRHKIDEWREFTDEQIVAMDFSALKFWRQWKLPLLAMCEAHRAE